MKIRIKVLAMFFALYSSAVFSAPYELMVWPSPDGGSDSLSMRNWDINDGSFNMMYDYATSDNLLYVFVERGISKYWSPPVPVPGARKAKTMGELGKLVIKAGQEGKSTSTQRTSRIGIDGCWMLGFMSPSGPGKESAGTFPGTPCMYGEYTPEKCWINEPYIELNHGILAAAEVNGNSTYTDIHVSCSTEMEVSITSQGRQSTLTLSSASGDRLLSNLMINDRKLGDGLLWLVASPSPTRVRLTSTLSNYDAQSTGEFSGSLPIIIGIP